MGKGGGCAPSKSKALVIAGHGAPPPLSKKSISTEGQSPSRSDVRNFVQDGALQRAHKKLRIFIVFYSVYGHVEALARKIKKGVDGVEGVEGVLYRVPETLAPEVLKQMKARPEDDEIPVVSVEELVKADGFLFGIPTRFGCVAAQMQAFFDSTGALWKEQKLAGVPAGFFVSTGTQGGGQETKGRVQEGCPNKMPPHLAYSQFQSRHLLVIAQNHASLICCSWTAITQLAHHGMLYVPIGYTFGAGMFGSDSPRGGSPYGAGVFSGDGTRKPSEIELALGEHQGKYMAWMVKRLAQPYSSAPEQ